MSAEVAYSIIYDYINDKENPTSDEVLIEALDTLKELADRYEDLCK